MFRPASGPTLRDFGVRLFFVANLNVPKTIRQIDDRRRHWTIALMEEGSADDREPGTGSRGEEVSADLQLIFDDEIDLMRIDFGLLTIMEQHFFFENFFFSHSYFYITLEL